jgi:hypothetical protein
MSTPIEFFTKKHIKPTFRKHTKKSLKKFKNCFDSYPFIRIPLAVIVKNRRKSTPSPAKTRIVNIYYLTNDIDTNQPTNTPLQQVCRSPPRMTDLTDYPKTKGNRGRFSQFLTTLFIAT